MGSGAIAGSAASCDKVFTVARVSIVGTMLGQLLVARDLRCCLVGGRRNLLLGLELRVDVGRSGRGLVEVLADVRLAYLGNGRDSCVGKKEGRARRALKICPYSDLDNGKGTIWKGADSFNRYPSTSRSRKKTWG